MIKTVGREKSCDYIIFDPERRVSRIHLQVEKIGNQFTIIDFSSNGTYIDGIRMNKGAKVTVHAHQKITLGGGYFLNLNRVFENAPNGITPDNGATALLGAKQVAFDPNRTTVGEILELESSKYTTIGRAASNHIVLSKYKRVSSNHCKIRLIGSEMIEVLDLNSTNGTFVDGKLIQSGVPSLYTNNAKVNLGGEITLNLAKIFPGIVITQRKTKPAAPVRNNQAASTPNKLATPEELEEFMALEQVYDEFDLRNKSMGIEGSAIALAGAAAGLVAALATGGLGAGATLLFMGGGGILGRYLGMQRTNEVKTDLNFEKAFFVAYSCPRCEESFQKKPWITIRECNKCKVIFRK